MIAIIQATHTKIFVSLRQFCADNLAIDKPKCRKLAKKDPANPVRFV